MSRARRWRAVATACVLGVLAPANSSLSGAAQAPAVSGAAATRLPITIERHAPGAPITLGLPFPKGALQSPDHVRVVTRAGREVPSQVTEVATWDPADRSLTWAWRAPASGPRRPGWSPTHGLRIFGWTHAYTLPYALAILDESRRSPTDPPGASRN